MYYCEELHTAPAVLETCQQCEHLTTKYQNVVLFTS